MRTVRPQSSSRIASAASARRRSARACAGRRRDRRAARRASARPSRRAPCRSRRWRRPLRLRRARRRSVSRAVASVTSSCANGAPPGSLDQRLAPCLVRMPETADESRRLPRSARSSCAMRTSAWNTKWLSGPPANAMPPVTVCGRSSAMPSSRSCMRTADREAGVELAVRDVGDVAPARSKRALAGVREAGAAVQRAALGERDHVVRVGDREREDPRLARDAERARRRDRAEDERRRLIDVPLRAVQLAVREGLHRIARGIGDRRGVGTLARPRVGVVAATAA